MAAAEDAQYSEARRAYRKGRYADALRSPGALSPYETAVCEIAVGEAEVAANRLEVLLAHHADPRLYAGLGAALEGLGRVPEAKKAYRKALVGAEQNDLANLNLGALLLCGSNVPGAYPCLARSLSGVEAAPSPLCVPAFQSGSLPSPTGGSIDRMAGAACVLLGLKLQEIGRFEYAVACFEQALRLDAANGAAYYALVMAGRADGALIDRMSALHEAELGPADRGPLCFALGKALADRGESARAMELIEEGNEIALASTPAPFDRDGFARYIDAVIENYTPSRIRNLRSRGCESETPVFIVGMMRSGTTLVEQIVSSHPDVVAGDELTYWRDRGGRFLGPQAPLPNPTQASALIEEYLRLLTALGGDALRVTDKMPQNFAAMGLIHGLFPNARFLLCRREAAENCLSIYTTSFRNPMAYACRRGDIAFFYRHFDRLMAHWKEVIPPDRLMELNYEELLVDREFATRRLIRFCGLDWHDDCLHPEQNRRPVKTASVWQVRQPVHAPGSDRSRVFQPWLEEFRALLS